MQLENVLQSLFEKTANCDPDIIRTLDHAEHNIELDYRGRYILELLQNARDVAMLGQTRARVKIILKENQLWIANNGASFNEDGLRSICRIGLSSKKDISFIGHKGLGFKSVMEISETPEIVTEYGTICFDREKACEKLNEDSLKSKELPLLFLPMFKSSTIADYKETLIDEFTTLIILPFKKGILAERIRKDFEQITISSFPLLGYFQSLSIVDETENNKGTTYTVTSPQENLCEIVQDSKAPFRLRIFEHKFKVTPEQYETLPDEEKESIDPNTSLEIKLALWLDHNGRFKPNDNLSLYLFYPLEEKSGFRFIIHSHFVVTPNRKELLEKSPLNKIIIEELVKYMTTDFLDGVMREFPNQIQNIFAFVRNTQSSLEKYSFYAKLIEAQKTLPLIWSDKHQKHLQISEILIANEKQLQLFADGVFANKILYKREENYVGSWMGNLLRGAELNESIIKTHIEDYAEKQREKGDVSFFQQLYLYCSTSNLYLTNKKILLTENNELLSSSSEVYYGGQRTELRIPAELSKTITFLHADIRIERFRVIESYIGAVEFKTEHLVKRVLKVIAENSEGLEAYLLILRDLRVEANLAREILGGIQLPIVNAPKCLSPLFNPIYFHSQEIVDHYPNALFVDLSKLLEVDDNEQAWRTFLESNNVWSCPAVYVVASNIIRDVNHLKLLGNTSEVTVKNDIVLDAPERYSETFQHFILTEYLRYTLFIGKIQNNWPFRKENKAALDPYKQSSFSFTIKNEEWLYPSNLKGEPHRPAAVLILPATDESQPQIKVLRKYVPIFFAGELQTELFRNAGAIQGRSLNNETAVRMFEWAKECQFDLPQEADFASAWNRLYGFLFEFWKSRSESDRLSLVRNLKQVDMLAEDIHDGKKQWAWRKADSTLYIDDKPLYDCLPPDIKSKLPPVFTKRDKNEIGIVLNRVGVVLSDKIKRQLVQPVIRSEVNLFEYWKWFPYAIPIIEQKIGSHVSDEILKALSSSTIALVDSLELEISISIEQTSTFNQAIPFHLEKTGENLYRIYKTGADSKLIVSVIHDLLEEIIKEDFDIRLELQELSRTRNENEVLAVINDLNIDIVRAKDVNEQFTTQVNSERLDFWNSFGKMFNILPLEQEDEIAMQFAAIAEVCPLSVGEIVEYDKQLSLQDVWSSSTIEVFRQLFLTTGKTIEEFNSCSNRKIDVSNQNKDLLYLVISQAKNKFVRVLFDLLQQELPEKQKRFLELIETYNATPVNVNYNSFSFDSQTILNSHIENILLTIVNDPPKINEDTPDLNEVTLYNEQRASLIAELRRDHPEIKEIDSYLGDIEIKSMLCFNVASIYEKILQNFSEVAVSSNQSEEETGESSMNDLPIVDSKPKFPKAPLTFGTSHGKGRGRSGGWGRSTPPSQATLDEIGYQGELYVYNKLSERYTVNWVSKNAEKARKVILGDDTLGYDMSYLNEEDVLNYIEVKATSGTSKQFSISRPEVSFGIANRENYFLYFVTNATTPSSTQASNLGNIFKKFTSISEFELSEDFQVESNGYFVLFD